MRSRQRNIAVGTALLAWAIVTPFMWRDLRDRPPDEVRGKKWMWWLASANLTGSLAYFLVGRKEAP